MSKHITKCGVCGIDVCTHVDDDDPVCVDCFLWAKRIEEEAKEPIFTENLANAWDSLEETQKVIEDSLAVFHQNGIVVDESFHNIQKVLSVIQSKIEEINQKGVKCSNYD